MAKARIVDENLEEMEDEVIKEGEIPIKIGRKVYTGRIIDNEGVKIHPAIDVVEGHAYLGYWATVEVLDEYGEVVTIDKVPILIRDDGLKILYAEKYLRQYGMSKMFTPVEWENWWSGKTVDVDPKEFYNEVYSKFTYYIDAPKHSYHLLTLWTIGTIFHPIFDSWPYIFLHGPKRSGKSLIGTSAIPILMSVDGKTYVGLEEIGKIVDRTLSEGKVVKEGEYEICYENPLKIKVLQLNPVTFKVEWVEPIAFIRHPFKGKMLKVKTRSGRVIVATKDHSFIVYRDGKLIVKDGRSLKVGDIVLTVRRVPSIHESKVNEEIAYIYGLFLADGSKGGIISCHDSGVRKRLLEAVEKAGLTCTVRDKYVYVPLMYKISEMFYENYDSKGKQYKKAGAKHKVVPPFVYMFSSEARRRFLAGYFDGDGYVEIGGKKGRTPSICAVSKSKKLIDGIGLLLLMEGIPYTIRIKKNKKYGEFYEIRIIGSGAELFKEKIAKYMGNEEKKNRIMQLKKPRFTLTDTVKGISGILRTIKDKKDMYSSFELSSIFSDYNINKGHITSQRLDKILKEIREIVEKTDIRPELTELEKILNADVFTDEIASIEEVEYEGYVYDLSTPYDNFVAEGVVVHNTKTLTLIGQMSYNSAPATSLSEAVLYRAVHNARHTLLMDEQETLANPNRKSEFRRLLLGGYKKGFYVWRSDKVKNDKIVPQKYMIYSPKAIANIEGMEDVLGDRSILVSIIRTSNIKIAKRGLKHLDPSWQPIRDKLASLFFKYHREVAECYDAAMRALGEEKDMSGIPDHLKPIFENIWNKIYARNLELWGPIFAVAIFFEKHGVRGIVESIAEFSMEDITVKKVDDIETPEAGLAYALAKLVTKNGWYSLSAIAEQYRMEMDLSKVDNRTVGRLMKRLGFKNKKKSGGKIQYYLTVDKVRDVAKRLEVPVDDMGGETSTSDIDPEVISRLRNFMGELGGEAHIRFVYAFLKAQGLSDIEVETLLKRLKNEGKIVAMEDGTIKTLLF